jgi:HD-GYP domain-containing protein (c-di-GMP phosphodiesterase class II)
VTDVDSGRAFYVGLLDALTSVMSAAKGHLEEHGPQVALLAAQIGAELGLDEAQQSELVFGAVLSDMGMVGLAEDAWENPIAELPEEARARVRQHPERSEERVREIPHLARLGPLLRHHHEWWDGSGYPDGLHGSDIPLGARILRLADTVVALRGERPHRSALGREEVRRLVEAYVGREFDAAVAETFLALHLADEVRPHTGESYRATVKRAADQLIPEYVSPLSTEQLLGIVADLVDAKDPYTSGHSRRVATLAVAVADQLGLEGHWRSALWAMGHLHDLGRLVVPLRVLNKVGDLTADDSMLIRAHPGEGADLLEGIPTLEHLTLGVRHHHERWDGSGYPEGRSGDQIPLMAQIIAVCDTYDAMTSRRAYRDSLGPEQARAEVRRGAGAEFAPAVAAAFLEIPDEVFERLDGRSPSALSELPQRVQTLRRIDPRWFTTDPIEIP